MNGGLGTQVLNPKPQILAASGLSRALGSGFKVLGLGFRDSEKGQGYGVEHSRVFGFEVSSQRTP